MMKNFVKILPFVVSLVLLAQNACKAAIIDFGSYTRDTSAMLDWLDVTTTQALSYNYVTANLLGTGNPYEGYRYATSTELSQLLSDAGIVPGALINSEPNYSINAASYNSLISMLGDTNTTSFETFGLLANIDSVFGGHMEAKILSTSTVLWSSLSFGSQLDSGANSVIGSFLVRDVTSSIATPIPAALPLFASGLGLMCLLGWRRKRMAMAASA
jgi:hypothetical protein